MVRCILIGFVILQAFAGCLAPLQTISPPPASRKHGALLLVSSHDPAVQEILIRFLRGTGGFRAVYAKNAGTPAPNNAEVFYLHADFLLQEPGQDLERNIKHSLKTLTLALRVSSSGLGRFRFTLNSGKNPASKKSFFLESRGRIGMWALLPPYAGFLGTILGTYFNSYRRPDRLQRECLNAPDPELFGNSACRDYKRFLNSVFGAVHLDFWFTLRKLVASLDKGQRRKTKEVSHGFSK